MKLRLGTRRSALATTQSGWVADLLRGLGHDVELVEIVTDGDVLTGPLTTIGGTGVFASALREAMRSGHVDLAVHSLKDLPVLPEPGLTVAAIPGREDPRDALVARDGLTLMTLPAGAVVGTGSPRRAAQVAAARPDLRIEEIRGNVDTRLGYVESGRCDAVVLARAGLARLGRLARITEVLDPQVMVPAAGQGALAVECAEARDDVRRLLALIDEPIARGEVAAERAALGTLQAGCTAPIGALARAQVGSRGLSQLHDNPDIANITLELTLVLGDDIGGSAPVRRTLTGNLADAVTLGTELAQSFLNEPGTDRDREASVS